jgi:hypothetical protein
MHVEAAEFGEIQRALGNNLAVSGDDDEFRGENGEGLKEAGVANFEGLEDGNFQVESGEFDGGGLESEIAALGTVRLAHDGGDFDAGRGGQGLKTNTGELRCSHEDDFHSKLYPG